MNGRRYTTMIAVVFLLVLSLVCSGCLSRSEQSYDKNGVAMDTTISLKATGPEAKEAVEESFARIQELDRLASAQRPDSDLGKLKAAAGKDYVQVDPAVYEMIDFAKTYSEKSQGAWDITTGVITDLWGIGTDNQRIPSDEEIAAAESLVNYKDILLRPEDHSVKLAKAGMSIDLGGIAKGYAVDEVRAIFAKHHIENGLINLGASSMYALGSNAKGGPWRIGIKHPRNDDKDTYLGIVAVSNENISTSGDYERFFEENGVRYHHIFDPKTGRPARSGVMSDSVLVDSSIEHGGMLGDMLTTILFVLGPERGMAFAHSVNGVEAMITTTDGKIYMTDGFKSHFSDLNSDFKLMP